MNTIQKISAVFTLASVATYSGCSSNTDSSSNSAPSIPPVVEPISDATIAPIPITSEVKEETVKLAMGSWNGALPDLSVVKLPKTPTSSLLKSVPDTLPGAEKIDNAITPSDPVMRIIFIQDYHGISLGSLLVEHVAMSKTGRLSPLEREKITKTFEEDSKGVQKIGRGINEIVACLSNKYGIAELYKEGSSVETVVGAMGLLQDFKAKGEPMRLQARNLISQSWKNHDSAYEQILKGQITEEEYQGLLKRALEVQFVIGNSLSHGAVDQCFLSDKIKMFIPAEISELHQAGVKLRSGEKIDDNTFAAIKLNDELRESSFLRIAWNLEQHSDKVACLVMGGAHNFIDNVWAWNEENPDKQIALTIISPVGFTKALNDALDRATNP